MNIPPVLQLQQLSFAYPGEPALAAGWTAAIGPGVTLLHGDTGTGKSALLRVLAGELAAGSGRLILAGAELGTQPAAYRRNLFFFDGGNDTFDAISARAWAASQHAADARFDSAAWQALADGFSLGPHLDKPMYMLSTGSRRKAWLASALASRRALLLLDEPTAALDAPSIRCLWAALAEVAARGDRGDRAVVIASSDRIRDDVPLAATIELPLSAAPAAR